jgi:alpha-mannosidase
MAEAVTTGVLIDPEDRALVARYRQVVRLWRGRPIIELEMELEPLRLPEGDPWSSYFASRFAWNDSAATLTRSVQGRTATLQWERFESPYFFEIATETQRTTILHDGMCFHRKTGPRMVDSLLIVAGETSRRFRCAIAIDCDYPLQPALDVLAAAAVVETAAGPPAAGRSGWLFHLNARNVQITQVLPCRNEHLAPTLHDGLPAPAASGYRFALRLVETEGRTRPVKLACFRTPTSARQRDLRGRTIAQLKIIDDAVLLEMTGYEVADVELHFDEPPAPVSP